MYILNRKRIPDHFDQLATWLSNHLRAKRLLFQV